MSHSQNSQSQRITKTRRDHDIVKNLKKQYLFIASDLYFSCQFITPLVNQLFSQLSMVGIVQNIGFWPKGIVLGQRVSAILHHNGTKDQLMDGVIRPNCRKLCNPLSLVCVSQSFFYIDGRAVLSYSSRICIYSSPLSYSGKRN